jgi:hypothetical protein
LFSAAESIELQTKLEPFNWPHNKNSTMFNVKKSTRNVMGGRLQDMASFIDTNTGIFNGSTSLNLSRQLSVFFLHLPLQSSYATYVRSGCHGVQVVFKRQKLFKEITVTRSCSVVII